MIEAQDEQIDNIGASVKVLKNLSTTIGTELEEQAGWVPYHCTLKCFVKYMVLQLVKLRVVYSSMQFAFIRGQLPKPIFVFVKNLVTTHVLITILSVKETIVQNVGL